jgi:hypothetical protein
MKEASEIARAHGDSARQCGYAEIFLWVPNNPGFQFLDVWPAAPTFRVFHMGAELGLSPGAAGKNNHHPCGRDGNFPAEIFFDQGQGEIDPRSDPARGIDLPVAVEEEAGIDLY